MLVYFLMSWTHGARQNLDSFMILNNKWNNAFKKKIKFYIFTIGVVLSNIIQFNIFLLDANFDNSIFFFLKRRRVGLHFLFKSYMLAKFWDD